MEIHFQGNQHHKFLQPNKSKGKKKSSSNNGNGNGNGKNKFVGVRQRPSGRWVAEIKDTTKNIRMWLGTFETPEAAARAYDEAACLLRGSNTRTNFLNTCVSPNSALASRIKTLLTNKKSNDNTTTNNTITPTKPSNTFSPSTINPSNNNSNINNFILTKNSSNDNDVMHGNVYNYSQDNDQANHTKVVYMHDHFGTHHQYSSSSEGGIIENDYRCCHGDIISRPTADDLAKLSLSQEIMMLEMMGKDEAIRMSPLMGMEKDIMIPASFCTHNNNNNSIGFGEIHEQQVEFVDCFLHDDIDMIDPTVYGLWDLPPAFSSFCSSF